MLEMSLILRACAMRLKTYPAAQQGALALGERLHDLVFTLPEGRVISLYHSHLFGWPVVLHLAATPDAAAAGCARLSALSDALLGLEARIYAVTGGPDHENAALGQRLGLSFPVICDAEGALTRALSLGQGSAISQGACTLVFDPLLRLEAVFAEPDVERQCDRALTWLQARKEVLRPAVLTAQPPVLVLPRVLTQAHCRTLIRLWETGDRIEGTVASEASGGNIVKRSKVRSDVMIPEDSMECRDLLEALSHQLLPEVLKGFGFRVTRVETPRVGCYDAAQGGYFAAHRDNTNRLTEHRRFAMTINLNTNEYEGGYLRFPEFGPQLYAPDVGGAVVFCCSLLHLATPVTKGRRFVLVAFFHGEEEEELRQRINSDLGTAEG